MEDLKEKKNRRFWNLLFYVKKNAEICQILCLPYNNCWIWLGSVEKCSQKEYEQWTLKVSTTLDFLIFLTVTFARDIYIYIRQLRVKFEYDDYVLILWVTLKCDICMWRRYNEMFRRDVKKLLCLKHSVETYNCIVLYSDHNKMTYFWLFVHASCVCVC